MNFFSNWAKNLIFLIVYILSGVTLVVIIDGLLTGTELAPFNALIEQVLVQIRNPLTTNILVTITNIGSPFILATVACFLAIVLVLYRDTYNALLFIVSMSLAIFSFTVLKNTFEVARPTSLIDVAGWSFPSGHATVATAFFFTLAHSFFGKVKTAWGKFVLILSCIIAAALVCFSRLYLGAHWGLDILAGIALGVLTVSFTVLVFNVFLEEKSWKRKRLSL